MGIRAAGIRRRGSKWVFYTSISVLRYDAAPSNAPLSREQEAELAHPTPQEWQRALSLPSQSRRGGTQSSKNLWKIYPLSCRRIFFRPFRLGRMKPQSRFRSRRRRRRLHLMPIRLRIRRIVQHLIHGLRGKSTRPLKEVLKRTVIGPALPNASPKSIVQVWIFRLWPSTCPRTNLNLTFSQGSNYWIFSSSSKTLII